MIGTIKHTNKLERLTWAWCPAPHIILFHKLFNTYTIHKKESWPNSWKHMDLFLHQLLMLTIFQLNIHSFL